MYTDLLCEQIDLLKNEIQQKNAVINNLLLNYEKLLNYVNNQNERISMTVNDRLSPRGLICQNEF